MMPWIKSAAAASRRPRVTATFFICSTISRASVVLRVPERSESYMSKLNASFSSVVMVESAENCVASSLNDTEPEPSWSNDAKSAAIEASVESGVLARTSSVNSASVSSPLLSLSRDSKSRLSSSSSSLLKCVVCTSWLTSSFEPPAPISN
eukprot:Amastigsp_a840997_2362.p3 type:complete len:151 gc:universal Amastigsp_a840997_2362:476-24(-)